MFGLGMWEILIILGLALVVIGPKKLPDIAASLAKGLRDFRKAADDFKNAVDITPDFKDTFKPSDDDGKRPYPGSTTYREMDADDPARTPYDEAAPKTEGETAADVPEGETQGVPVPDSASAPDALQTGDASTDRNGEAAESQSESAIDPKPALPDTPPKSEKE